MTRVYIEMEQGWNWWPVLETDISSLRKKSTFDVDPALIEQYRAAVAEYDRIQQLFEQLYRIQQGLDPWPGQEIPLYKWASTEESNK